MRPVCLISQGRFEEPVRPWIAVDGALPLQKSNPLPNSKYACVKTYKILFNMFVVSSSFCALCMEFDVTFDVFHAAICNLIWNYFRELCK